MNAAKVYILIPVYNEAQSIGEVVRSLRQEGFHHILVVNDGSTDETGALLSSLGVETIHSPVNLGQGGALKIGLEYLRDVIDPDVVVTFDGDGQHNPRDIPALISPLVEHRADIVLGSRFLNAENTVPFLRKCVLKAAVFFTNIVSHVQLTDTHNGLRALSKRALHTIRITQRDMTHASEIIDQISQHKLRYTEVPVRVTYSGYSLRKGQKVSRFLGIGVKFIVHKLFP